MISDEPDEDADVLDDAAVLDTYLGDAGTAPQTTPSLPDWPREAASNVHVNLDSATLAWFQATHEDWQRAIRTVLQAWASARKTARHPQPVPVFPKPSPQDEIAE